MDLFLDFVFYPIKLHIYSVPVPIALTVEALYIVSSFVIPDPLHLHKCQKQFIFILKKTERESLDITPKSTGRNNKNR